MKTLSSLVLFVLLAAGVPAQEVPAGDALGHISRSAAQELAGSIDALNALRERITEEKLPLAQQLTAAEEQLTELRREHDRVSRLVDASNLELPTIKAEMKAREDEQSYIGNLLDEYARTFDSRIHVSELQYCGEDIVAAKLATENTTLSAEERFARQAAFVDTSLRRLFESLGGMRFPGVGVDLEGAVVEGQFALFGPVALFRATSGMAGVVIPQSGSDKPLIRPLDGPIQAGLGSLVETGSGIMPLDPSRGGALKQLVQKTNLIHIFIQGGPIMWPLLFCSVLALGVVIERFFFLMGTKRRRDPKAMEAFFTAAARNDPEEAIRVGNASKFYVVRTLAYALSHKETSLANAVMIAQGEALKRFRRGIPVLDTIITLAPLLGLLGTVTGMMASFAIIGGDLSAPGAITGGIAEALIATAYGLGIAIVCLIPFNILNTRLEEARAEIESAATKLELILHPHAPGMLSAVAVQGGSAGFKPQAHAVQAAGRS